MELVRKANEIHLKPRRLQEEEDGNFLGVGGGGGERDEESASGDQAAQRNLRRVHKALQATTKVLRVTRMAAAGLLAVVVALVAYGSMNWDELPPAAQCGAPPSETPYAAPAISAALSAQIASKSAAVAQIAGLLSGEQASEAFNRLAWFSDTFGNRPAGSPQLESAIDGVVAKLTADGISCWTENATIPHWERGEESLTLVAPAVGGRELDLPMLGLGTSIGTQNLTDGSLTAEAIVVRTFDELRARAAADPASVAGKIVVFNQEYRGYGPTVGYRYGGAAAAAKLGAAAVLVRSVAPFSLRTPHAGAQAYEAGVRRIPAASITVEDALMLARMQVRIRILIHIHINIHIRIHIRPRLTHHCLCPRPRPVSLGRPLTLLAPPPPLKARGTGVGVRLRLRMGARTFPDVVSRNVVAEIPGAGR
jgi:hypothetical protein